MSKSKSKSKLKVKSKIVPVKAVGCFKWQFTEGSHEWAPMFEREVKPTKQLNAQVEKYLDALISEVSPFVIENSDSLPSTTIMLDFTQLLINKLIFDLKHGGAKE